ncbi:glutathione peroxidase [Rhodoferax sp. TBRC 17198]|uniref:glutathione peroxidase n=1 Tax=Rhodoferax potami TaxID=3068338 RepID=UPI0028BDBF4D|nr:glutathione peroxidase [Rhodoferax sp. TBRC 17198]MDT7523805.1 glutathione peroxidase [Rhodoferax sp. TBRC 17198]
MASGIQQAASAAFLLGIAAGVSTATPLDSKAAVCPALWQKNLPRLQDDSPQNLCQYSGKVALVVNTASYCGFTSQYQGLEKVYARFQQRGLVVMGFPSNDFGQQEPGNSKQIADLCFNTYGVKFPMFAKSAVTGVQANPLFKELAAQTGQSPRWNFHKYLVDRRGKVVGSFPSDMSPEDPKLIAQIEKVLTAP